MEPIAVDARIQKTNGSPQFVDVPACDRSRAGAGCRRAGPNGTARAVFLPLVPNEGASRNPGHMPHRMRYMMTPMATIQVTRQRSNIRQLMVGFCHRGFMG